jgi:hypothetical protein
VAGPSVYEALKKINCTIFPIGLLKDENEHVILDYIDIQNWIKSKITDKSFVELVKAQTKA